METIKYARYSSPKIEGQKILYKGRRYWVIEMDKNLPFELCEDICDAFDEKWEQGFSRLEQFVAEFGHCKVPKRYLSPDKFTLGTWVLYQRMGFAQKKISRDRILKIESLADWFW